MLVRIQNPSCEDPVRKRWSTTQKRPLTQTQSGLHTDPGLAVSRALRNKRLLFVRTQSIVLCNSSANGLTYWVSNLNPGHQGNSGVGIYPEQNLQDHRSWYNAQQF